MFTGLTLNNGKSLQFGDLCHWYNPSCDGYNPVSTRIPDTLKFSDYKSEISSLEVGIDSIIQYIIGMSWNEEDFGVYCDSIRDFMESQVIWLWGSFDDGGAFLYNNGNTNSCGFCTCWYTMQNETTDPQTGEPTVRYSFWTANSANVPYQTEDPATHLVSADNQWAFFKIWTRTPDVGDLLPPGDKEALFYVVGGGFPALYDDNTDVLTQSIDPNTGFPVIQWVQTQHNRNFSWSNWRAAYTKNYTSMTDMQGTTNDDHPWARYIQERVVSVTGPVRLYPDESDTSYVVGSYMGGGAVDEAGNPYGGDTSGEGGGNGSGTDSSDNIDDGGLPSSALLNTGMTCIYLPTSANMSSFADFLFNDITSTIETKLKKLWSSPIESILSLSLCHIKIPYTSSNSINFAGVSSGVSAPVANSIYYKFSYILNLNEYWGGALDYSSYTKMKIYLPYCGIYDVNIDDFMGGTMKVTYKVDLLSGMCVALVKSMRSGKQGTINSELYQFSGNIFLPVPITSNDWTSLYQSVLGLASVAIAPSPMAAVGMAETVMSQKVNVQKSGSIGSNYGYLGIQTPYVIIERPCQSLPVNFGDYYGYPSNIYGPISTFTGYIEVDPSTVWSNNIPCTDQEAEEIKSLFEEGVYL